MGGAIIGRAELIDSMRDDIGILGPTLDPHAAFLLQRGMKTYFVRWDAQCRNAQRIAEHLSRHPRIERVRFPGLPGDPGHERARQQMHDFGTIVTIDVVGDETAGARFAEQLQLFSITASLGSTESLVVPPDLLKSKGFTAEQQRWADIGPGTVRLSIGLEDIDDLIDDLDKALDAANHG